LAKIVNEPDKNAREIVEIVVSASPELRERMLEALRAFKLAETEEFRRKPKHETHEKTLPSLEELKTSFMNGLSGEQNAVPTVENKSWTGPTPEQERKIRDLELEQLAKLTKKHHSIEKAYKLVGFIKAESNQEEILKSFLLEQYKGHCQICNVRLDISSGKTPYFEVYHLIEKRQLASSWSIQGFNALCLCPNCFALMKHGEKNLKPIPEIALKTITSDIAPEEVSERHGDYYILPICLIGEQKELFISPVHMTKIAAFLQLVNQ